MSRKTVSMPEIQRIIERIPKEMSSKSQERLCDEMKLVILAESSNKEENEVIEEQSLEMTRLMHTCMHLGPQISGIVALNCLVGLEMILKEMIPNTKDRMGIHSALVAHAVKIVAAHDSDAESLTQTKH